MIFILLLFSLGILGSSGYPAESCPVGSTRHGNSCYLIGHLLANWPEAVIYCMTYNAHLAHIETAQEQRFITGMLHQSLGEATDPKNYFWIGGTDAASEGQWVWTRTTEPIEFTNWAPGNPNNNGAHADHHQDCMAIYGQTGLWDDGYCETKHNFLCEVELADSLDIVG